MAERIRSFEQLNKRMLYDGMIYNLHGKNLVPLSDIDGILDAAGKGYIIYETKFGGASVPKGQRIMLERLVNDLAASEKPAVLFVVYHREADDDGIMLKDGIVTEVYSNKKGWQRYGHDYMYPFTAGELTDVFIKQHAPEMLITKPNN